MPVKKAAGYTLDMTNGPLLSKMLVFALPLMLSTMLQLLFNAADLVVVSRFAGDNAMAAVGANTSIINLLVNSFMGLSIGANVLAARERGAGDHEEVNRTVHTAMALSLVGGVALIFVGVLGARWILTMMDAPANILEQAILYLRLYFLGMPAIMLYNFGAALLRSVGDTRRPLVYLTVAGVVNVCLNLVLVIVFRLDVAGVAIATVVSQVISALLVVRCMMRDGGDLHLELRKLRIYPDKLKDILRVGLPAGLQSTLFSLSNVVIQSSVNSFGEIVVAGNSAAHNLEGFFYCSVSALMQANISFVGQNMGAKKYRRVPRIMLTSYGCMVAAQVMISLICIFFGRTLLGIYTGTEPVLQAALSRLTLLGHTYVICGFMDLTTSTLRGMGRGLMPMIVSLAGVVGTRMLWIFTVFRIPEYHTLWHLLLSYPISWLITFSIHFICWLITIRPLLKQEANLTERSAI